MQTDTQPVDLKALRSSAKAFRDYPVRDSGGDPVYLTERADELDAAAAEIEVLRAQVAVMRGALLKLEAMCIGPLTPMSEGDTRLILSPNGRDVLVTARAALGDAK
jgi:hypothetical protein